MAPAAWRGRPKRVTDPLDDRVKARLRGDDDLRPVGSSSGSEHDGDCSELSGFADGFFQLSDREGNEEDARSAADWSDGEAADRLLLPPPVPVVAMVRDLLRSSAADPFRRELAVEVTKAVQSTVSQARFARPAAFRRAVMSSLRESGYNAGICKAKWETHGGLTAGNYEYIDVLREPPTQTPASQQLKRYIVDVEFAGEFEIARPTAEYEQLAAELPRVYVGTAEELRRLLRLLADAAKRSLRAREMHVPPWRKSRYMQAKWLGSYRRTLNPAPPSGDCPVPPPPPASFAPGRNLYERRCVGFEPVMGQRVITPAARAV